MEITLKELMKVKKENLSKIGRIELEWSIIHLKEKGGKGFIRHDILKDFGII